ncbi:MAG: TlpA family protein disulfide reductase [Actinomycetes bacterium]
MRRTTATLAALALAVTACGGAGGGTTAGAEGTGAPGGGATPITAFESGEPLPEAEFPVLGDRDTLVSTADWRGTPTVVNFWATWCAFCVEEMPDLEAAHQQLGDAVRFVGIARQDNVDKALTLADETGVTYDLLEDGPGTYFNEVGARGMPTTLFVDAAGAIVYRHTGPISAEQLVELVAEHLDVTA